MEKLSTKQQVEVGKMSTERLRMKFAKAGYDEETVATADRTVLQNMFAEYLLAPSPVTAAAAEGGVTEGGMTEEELDLRLKSYS